MTRPTPLELLRRGGLGLGLGALDATWTLASSPLGWTRTVDTALVALGGWMMIALFVAPQRREPAEHAAALGLVAALLAAIGAIPWPAPWMARVALVVAVSAASARPVAPRIGVGVAVLALFTWPLRAPWTAPRAASGDGPNILFVTVDTFRADGRSSARHGLGEDLTPFLDKLATRGCAVEPAFSTSPLTGPSHAALHSGVHPIDLGVLLNARPLPTDIPWLAEELAAAGYRTEAFVSSAMLDGKLGYGRGFDRYDDDIDGWTNARRTALGFALGTPDAQAAFERPGTETLHRFATSGSVDGPLFAWVHLYDPHRPYTPTEQGMAAVTTPVELPGASAFDHHPVGPPPVRGAPGGQLAALHTELFGGVGRRPATEREMRDGTASAAAERYLGEIHDTDALVAAVFAAFEARTGAPPDAWVVVGDHGESLTEHHELGSHQRHLYRANTEVPLLLSGPCPEGPVSTVHVADAVRALAGLSEPTAWQGPAVSAVMGPPHGVAAGPLVRKLVYREEGREVLVTLPPSGRTQEFYDLAKDPHERFPLPLDPAMLQRVQPWIDRLEASRTSDVDAEMREALEALGYVQ
ncbi:MAG: hypothetical protein EP330_19220 [Deltaproteobacteria bacterium]|nr:MAG: hypothetical protein EP330_19220 [Deltaproteobacteria bacterium]